MSAVGKVFNVTDIAVDIINTINPTVYNQETINFLDNLINNYNLDVNATQLPGLPGQDSEGNSLLHLAIQRDNYFIAIYLIQHDAHIDKYLLDYLKKNDKKMNNILLICISLGKTKLFNILYDNNIQFTDKEGNTLLHFSAEANALEISKKLIDSGLSLYTENKEKKTPLDFITNDDVKKKLIEYQKDHEKTLKRIFKENKTFKKIPEELEKLLKEFIRPQFGRSRIRRSRKSRRKHKGTRRNRRSHKKNLLRL